MGGDLTAEELRLALLKASESFHRSRSRHVPRLHRIYGSFSLPGFTVPASEAQRDTARRLERFGVTHEEIAGKSVLDLGCHVGSVLFEVQQFGPGRCLGVEYDADKVAAARAVAGFCGLDRVKFRQADVDTLAVNDLGGAFDVVFCLALEAHVGDRDRLYRLLGETTRGILLFEGNASTVPAYVIRGLRHAGFLDVEFLGNCDDDARPANNVRPMFVAQR